MPWRIVKLVATVENTALWGLLSAVVGAVTTYLVTRSNNKTKLEIATKESDTDNVKKLKEYIKQLETEKEVSRIEREKLLAELGKLEKLLTVTNVHFKVVLNACKVFYQDRPEFKSIIDEIEKDWQIARS